MRARVARGRTSTSQLQEQLDSRTRELVEARELQAASAEVLRVISTSPNDVQPVFDAIAESAVRLCQGQLARMMGGDVTVASEPGKGSVFTVRLPGGDHP